MQRRLISLAVLTLLGLGSTALALAAPAATTADKATIAAHAPLATTQLPRNAVPTHYALSLTPDAANARFAASVVIALEVTQRSTSLTLNAADLVFSAAAISAVADRQAPRQASRTDVDAAKQTVTFHFAQPLQPGSYQLKLDYTGMIRTQAEGLFSLDYQNGGSPKRALYTQFENSEARRMIPSWDEPAYKATFALEVTAPAGQMAVSNMPATSTSTLPDGRQLVRFATTPKMSTYLLFFGLGEFDRATAMENGTELGVVTQKSVLGQAQFALDSSRAVLREYNDYFGISYPLPKLDNIAAPGRSQFFGAMENWGAIFTFESAMLLDPAIATQADKQESFLVAAHEIAHQWFGDLVTMRWWDDLWLNEGFASWMESRTTARLHPEWHTDLNAVTDRNRAMAQDALVTTHPVVQKIATVEQASQAFDSITYQKGQAVIGMLENYVGETAWRDGVRAYIAKHAYGNTVSDDLWREVERSAHKPVIAIAHDFTLQPGVPLIRVGEALCRNGATSIALTQGEFSKDAPDRAPRAWQVPLIARTMSSGQAGAPARTVVAGGKASLLVPGCGMVLVNAGQSGYYRTLYAPKAFAALADGFGTLPAIDQLGLLGDSWALGQAGLQPAPGVLELAARTPPDGAAPVWGQIAAVYGEIDRLYQGKPAQRERFGRYARARLAPILAQLGWQARPGEAEPLATLRAMLVTTLSDLDDQAVIAEARRRYVASATDATAMPPALRRAILGVVAAHADAGTWQQLQATARQAESTLVKNELYDLLGSAADAKLAQQALDLALTPEPGATNSAAIISQVARRHPELALDFALAHRTDVENKVDATSRSRYFAQLASRSADPATVSKLQAYAQRYLAAESRAEARAAVASIGYRIMVREQRLPEIDAWLASK